MKAKGRHREKALTALQVRQAKTPGRYTDGNGLYLVVDPSGAKRWLLRVTVQGRRRDIGLGGANLVSLGEAREKAHELRKIARAGGDPLAQRRETQKVIPTFRAAAELVHAEHELTWKNSKHAAQWLTTLKKYAYPVIGDYRVDSIDTPAVLRVLSPIWLTKPETARRVRQRIGTVLDWAKASGFRRGDNPIDGVARGLPKQSDKDNHHAALPFAKIPEFIVQVRANNSREIAKLAFEFLILTVTRTSETLLARRSEINRSEAVWIIPEERMKAKREHRVPLSQRCIEIVDCVTALAPDSELLFPNDQGKPLSNMVFLAMLRRMKADITAHGFRSAFSDWAAETTSFPREVAEMALAHTIQNKVEAAYRRGDLFEKRRDLMAAWQAHCLPNALP